MTGTEKKGFVSRAHSKVMSSIKSQLGAFLLVSAAFTLGYAVKNMEDRHERLATGAELREQQKMMNASCDARVFQLDQAQQRQMLERDNRLNDQIAMINEQKDMIAALTRTTNTIADRQAVSIQQRKSEIAVVKKAADAAQTAAKGATTADKEFINRLVKEKSK